MRLGPIAVGVGLVRITDGAEQFGGRGYGQIVQVDGYYRAKQLYTMVGVNDLSICRWEGRGSMIASKAIMEAGSVKLTVDREILTH